MNLSKLKSMIAAAVAAIGIAAFAEPSAQITKVELADAHAGTVDLTYTVSGDCAGYNLYITVSSDDGTKSTVLTKENVTAGTKTETVNVKTLLGKAYPGVSFFAKLQLGVQLWENGPYFAKCNVGASSPEEYGYYFWWGDTVGYERNSSNNGWVSADGKGTAIQFSSSDVTAKQTYNHDNTWLKSNGWIDDNGNLVVSDDAAKNRDAARAHLGAPWRMMTDAELQKLVSGTYTTTTWETLNGVYGRRVTGKGAYVGNSIFLPAAGYGNGASLNDSGSYGDYWSSAPGSGNLYSAWSLYFGSSVFGRYNDYRYYGFPVRPVRDAQ